MKTVTVYTVVKETQVELEDDDSLKLAIDKALNQRDWKLSQVSFLTVSHVDIPEDLEVDDCKGLGDET